MNITVREMDKNDISLMVDYFINSESEFLISMGVDKGKFLPRQEWIKMLDEELKKSYIDKQFYYIIWLLNSEPIGHSNINKIIYNDSAYMHLHIWNNLNRKLGLAPKFVNLSLPYYFRNFNLQKVCCEPYYKNIGPNSVLQKVGFKLLNTYESVPGWINFFQRINHYELTKEMFLLTIV